MAYREGHPPDLYCSSWRLCAVNPRPKSVVQEICTLRSVGGGGRRLPPPTRWVSSNGHPYRDPRPTPAVRNTRRHRLRWIPALGNRVSTVRDPIPQVHSVTD